MKIAVVTPTILPVPTRPASDNATDWKVEIPRSDFSPLTIRLIISRKYGTWKNRSINVNKIQDNSKQITKTRLQTILMSMSTARFMNNLLCIFKTNLVLHILYKNSLTFKPNIQKD